MPLLPDPDDQPDRGRPAPDERSLRPPPAAPLTRREHDVLSGIEADLAGADPGLAGRMSQLGGIVTAPLPPIAHWGIAMAVWLLVLVVVIALLTPAGWVVLGLVVVLVLPRLLLMAITGRPSR